MEPPALPPDGVFRFRARLTTRWVDEDNQAVLNNAVTLTLLEEARLRYFRALDLMDGAQFPFVLAQCNVRFVSPGRGGAEVEVAARTTHVGTSSFVQAYRVTAVDDGAVWSEAEALLVAWDNEARAKRPMTERFAAAVREFEGL